MREKIRNCLKIKCDDIDLTTLTNIEFYVRQMKFFATYAPTVLSQNEMLVVIPFEDAMQLNRGEVRLQFAFTNEDGTPDASEIVVKQVDDLLKEVGYDPI